MSIPKKGSRKIIVQEEPFIWRIRKKATYLQSCYPEGCLYIAVEHDREPGSNLIIETDRLHPKGFNLTQIDPIIPADVALWIEQALEMGWMPKKSSQPFCAIVVEGALKIAEF
jgi:hypothetical protein